MWGVSKSSAFSDKLRKGVSCRKGMLTLSVSGYREFFRRKRGFSLVYWKIMPKFARLRDFLIGSKSAEWRLARLSKITDYERTNGFVENEKAIVDCRMCFVGVRNRYLGLCMYGYVFRCVCCFGGDKFRGVRHLRILVRTTGEKAGR